MHVLIVYCHPEPKSFNAALKDVSVETFRSLGYTVEVSDLYGEKFDPLEKPEHYTHRRNPKWFSAADEQRHASGNGTLPDCVTNQIERLERADFVLFQFPLWWHAVPAILKGWFDRVFVNGLLYSSTMRYDRGYFKGKKTMCSVTTGAPEMTFQGNGRGGNMDVMLWSTHYSLYYMGFEVLQPNIAFGIQSSGFTTIRDDQMHQHLDDQKSALANRLKHIEQMQPLFFPGWNDWDSLGCQKLT